MKRLIIEYTYPVQEEKNELGVIIKEAAEEFFHLYIDRGDLTIILQEQNDVIIRDVSYLNEIFLKYIPEYLLSKLLLNLNLAHYMNQVVEYKNKLFTINEEKLYKFILQNSNFIKDKIKMLKQQLANSDYKVIKCYEAQLGNEEIPYNLQELLAERKAYREKINALEFEIAMLG
jgi:hypothetical protein